MPTLTKTKRTPSNPGGKDDNASADEQETNTDSTLTTKGVDEGKSTDDSGESKLSSANSDAPLLEDSENKVGESVDTAKESKGSKEESVNKQMVESTSENNDGTEPTKEEDAGGTTSIKPSAKDGATKEKTEEKEKAVLKGETNDKTEVGSEASNKSREDSTDAKDVAKKLEGVKDSNTVPSSSRKRNLSVAQGEDEGAAAASSSGSTPSKKKAKMSTSIGEATAASSIVDRLHERFAEADYQSHQGDFIKLSLKLPPSSERIGLILQDDSENYGLPVLMALTPDSPLNGVIPQTIIQRYWIIGIADGRHKTGAKITSSEMLQKELMARRKKDKHVVFDFMFAKRRESPAGSMSFATRRGGQGVQPQQLQQQMVMQQMQAQVQMQAEMALRQQLVLNAHQQQMQHFLQQQLATHPIQQGQMTEQQRLHQLQQQRMQDELAGSARHKTKKKGTKASGTARKAPDEPSTRDEIIRQALIDFFTEGESRSLETFCRARSRMFKAIDDEVIGIPGLKEIVNRREEGKGFSQKDCEGAWHLINIIFSGGQNKINKRKSRQLDDEERRKRPNFDPFKPTGQCKGVQVKAVDDWFANKNNDNAYLIEPAGLANFQGWRKKDCLFIAELDGMGRCMKCRNHTSNLKRCAPNLYNPPPAPTAKESLLPKTREIIKTICNRIEQIEPEDLPDDPELTVAAKILKLKGKYQVDLKKEFPGHKNRSIFLICADCDKHLLKRESVAMTNTCEACGKKRFREKKSKAKQEKNNEKWVAHDSTVAFENLNSSQIRERFDNLRTKKKELERKVQQLENREAKQKKKEAKQQAQDLRNKAALEGPTHKQQRQHGRAPLLPWPFYLNYNPMVASEYTLPASMPAFSVATTTAARVAAASVPPSNVEKSGSTPAKNEDNTNKGNPPVKDADKGHDDKDPADSQFEKEKEAVNVDIADEPLTEAEVDVAEDGLLV